MGLDTAAADRLPWLADEPSRKSAEKRHPRTLLPWAAAALAVVGTAGFWLGVRSVGQTAPPLVWHAPPTTTLRLPPASPTVSPQVEMRAQPDVRPTLVPDVRPTPPKVVRIIAPPRPRAPARVIARAPRGEQAVRTEPEPPQEETAVSAPANGALPIAAPAPFVMPAPWNPRVFAGAAGRLVQVGAFGSVTQAKRGWWFMVRDYPAMAHLPAVVRPTRNSKGRIFYRFQVGTTSQAHSEVLCQRMQKIRLSCAVVGLPWKAKVER